VNSAKGEIRVSELNICFAKMVYPPNFVAGGIMINFSSEEAKVQMKVLTWFANIHTGLETPNFDNLQLIASIQKMNLQFLKTTRNFKIEVF
jgi:hypothetical protein